MESDEPITVTIHSVTSVVRQPTGSGFPVVNPRVVLQIQIGSDNTGGGSGTVQMYALAGNPVQVSGSRIYVRALICPNEVALLNNQVFPTSSVPIPTTVNAVVTALIAPGAGRGLWNTQWIVPEAPLQYFQQVTIGPSRIHQVQGFNHSAELVYLMFFDSNRGPPADGTAPLWTIPLSGLPTPPIADSTFSNDFIVSGRVFQYGCIWVASSTPDTLTKDTAALVRVDVEVFGQEVTLASIGTG